MKKLVLLTAVTIGATVVGYAQGTLNFTDTTTPGYVVQSPYPYSDSTVTAQYIASPNFTVQLWAISGNPTDTSGLAFQPDSYGYLTEAQFTADGFNLIGSTLGGTANGVTFGGGDGYFLGGTLIVAGSPGSSVQGSTGTVLAVVAWTGNTETTLASAISAGESYGIMAFWNPLGPGGLSTYIPNMTGWPSTANPASIANEPPGYPELIMSPVPEPATFALMGLGSLSLLLFRRRK